MLACEEHGGDHVGRAPAACDERRPVVYHRVPDGPGGIVAVISWSEELAAQSGTEALDSIIGEIYCGHRTSPPGIERPPDYINLIIGMLSSA